MTANSEWKIMVMDTTGVYFQGEKCLEEDPDKAKWYHDIDDAIEQVKDTARLNFNGVLQFRLISEHF